LNGFSSIDLLIVVIAFVCLVVAAIFIPRYMVLNAMKKIIRTMIKEGAYNIQKALPPEQIGVGQKSPWGGMLRMRDYRPQALYMLVDSEILVNTLDGRYYISVDRLQVSRFSDLYNEAD
jgi:hypothetical protein